MELNLFWAFIIIGILATILYLIAIKSKVRNEE